MEAGTAIAACSAARSGSRKVATIPLGRGWEQISGWVGTSVHLTAMLEWVTKSLDRFSKII